MEPKNNELPELSGIPKKTQENHALQSFITPIAERAGHWLADAIEHNKIETLLVGAAIGVGLSQLFSAPKSPRKQKTKR